MKTTHFHNKKQLDNLNIKENQKQENSYRKSLAKILEAIYIQKIKETNTDYLSFLNFNEIINLPSIVSESIFNALIREPRNYIKLEEFVEGLSVLYDKHIDFDFNEKTNVPRIYEILYKVFCLKKKKNKANCDSKISINENENINNSNLSAATSNADTYGFYFHFDLEHFNKIISNILLMCCINGNNLNIEEFLPFCEEIKLTVKKTFNRNSNNLNINFNEGNSFNFSNISSIKTNNNINNFHNLNSIGSINTNNNNNCNTFNSSKTNEKEFPFNNPYVNINPILNFDSNVNLNLNLKMNIKSVSTILDNQLNSYLNQTNNDPQNARNTQKDFISLDEFIECLQKNSKLLFILLLLIYSLSPVNQKLVYLLTKHPDSKLINDSEDDIGDFIEENEKTQDIQVLPLSYKKLNLGEIKNDSKSNTSQNNLSKDNSFETMNLIPNDIIKKNYSKKNSENFNKKLEENASQAKIEFDLSENSDTFSQSLSYLNNETNNKIHRTGIERSCENFNDSNKTFSMNGGSSMNLNNFTNKSKFYNKNSLFDKNNTIGNNNDNDNNENANDNNLGFQSIKELNEDFPKNEIKAKAETDGKNNVINFNFDDSSSIDKTYSIQDQTGSLNAASNNASNKFSYSNKKSAEKNLLMQSHNTNFYESESKIVVYRHVETNESSVLTNNNVIFDSRFKQSFENIIVSNRDESQNSFGNLKKVNTLNSLYNDFNDLLFAKNKTNNTNKYFNGCKSLPSRISTIELNDNYNNFRETDNLLEETRSIHKNFDKSSMTYNSLNKNSFYPNNDFERKQNNQFAFEEVFSEYKISVEKVKIPKDFIFNPKKCQEFSYQSKNNKSFFFKNFNFNLEDDWLLKNLKKIYMNINTKHLSEIKNFNKHLSFLTVFYQFGDSNSETNKNNYLSNKENLTKHKSKNLRKSIADIIDDYLVLFTFNNAFEANFIQNYMQNKKEKLLRNINTIESKNKQYENNNDREFQLSEYNRKINNPNNKNINKSNSNSQKEDYYVFSDKTTNYRDSYSKLSIKNYLITSKDAENLKCKENINFIINENEEENSNVFSVLDVYESNNLYSLNLKLIVNLRNCKIKSFEATSVNGIQLYPISLKQEDNLFMLFFETEIERDILIDYQKDKLLNINPIKDFLITDVIVKNKYLEFCKAEHKETKETVEIKKYLKNKIKSSNIIKEISSIRDLSLVHKFFSESKIPKINYFENAEEIYIVYENNENDPVKFIFMNPELKITKDVSKYSINVKKMKELKSMLEILSISLVPKVNVD